MVTGALVGGALFMRLGTWLQHVDLRQNATLAEQWAYGNRSILGGLVGAWLGVHVAKRLSGYRPRTGDLFAPAVALGMAVGRIGCLLTEQPGTRRAAGGSPSTSGRAHRLAGRLPLHPSFLYEIAFHLAAFAAIWWWLRHRPLPPGEIFVWYVAAYGVFRFLRRVRARQRGRLARADPPAAVPRRDDPARARCASCCRRVAAPTVPPAVDDESGHAVSTRTGPGMPLRGDRIHRYVNAFCPLCHEERARPPARRGAAALRLAGRARRPRSGSSAAARPTAWSARCTTSRRRS